MEFLVFEGVNTCKNTHDSVVSSSPARSHMVDAAGAVAAEMEASVPDMVKLNAILIEWDSEQRTFRVVSEESMIVQYPVQELVSDDRGILQRSDEEYNCTDHELRKLIGRFPDCLGNRAASAAIADAQELRTRVLMKILKTQTPWRWLSVFLYKWQDLVSLADGRAWTLTDPVDYCQELVALAGGWKLIGDVVQARSTLGKCFEVSRQYLKTPFAEAALLEEDKSLTLRHVTVAAKKALLKCVKFQTSLAHYKELLGRHEAPPHVQASISNAFWNLLREAPLSVELALLLAQSLMKQKQYDIVARFLERSPFSRETAELALVHARTLTYLGFYSRSIQVAQSFITLEDDYGSVSIKALRAHCDQLEKLLACRERADEWLRRDHFDKAAIGFGECLALVDPADRKQIAALLFGHANALLGMEQLCAAIDGLRKSLQLDRANKIASIRLQTACLQLETERIKKELSRSRSVAKLHSSSSW